MACLFQETWPFTVALEGMQDHECMTEKRHELMSRARAGGQRFGEAWPQVLRPCTDLVGSIIFMSQMGCLMFLRCHLCESWLFSHFFCIDLF